MSDIKILEIDSNNWKKHENFLKEICKLSEQDYSEASKNIHWENWDTTPASLMYCIVKKKRFDNGKFFILLKDNKPISASGCYLSPWSKEVMIVGSRTWTALDERDEWWQGDYLLPKQYELAKKFKSKAVMFTFNLYNEWLIKFLKRIKERKAVTLGEKNSDFYKDLIFFDNIYYINNTKQKIAVKLIDCTKEQFIQNYLPEEWQ